MLDCVKRREFSAHLFKEVSNAAYHSGPGISNSGLSLIAQTPAHYYAAYLDPNREPRKTTKALSWGTAIHTAVLEPKRYAEEYVREPQARDYPEALVSADDYKARAKELEIKGVSGAKKDEIKELIKACCDQTVFFDDIVKAATEGRTVLTATEADACEAIAARVRTNKTVSWLLEGGAAEQSIYWIDEETGVLCRCRPDYLSPMAIVDLKSTEDASPEAFTKSIWNYDYWVQAAYYQDGVKAATGKAIPFVLVPVEKGAPNLVATYAGDKAMIDAGRKEYKRRLKIYAECLRTGEWPGYSPKIETVSFPPFAQRELEERGLI